jgi:hypothetical protein
MTKFNSFESICHIFSEVYRVLFFIKFIFEKTLQNAIGKFENSRHERDWSFSDLFDRIFKIFKFSPLIFKFSNCILQRLFKNKFNK